MMDGKARGENREISKEKGYGFREAGESEVVKK